jgi:hypothetical protein
MALRIARSTRTGVDCHFFAMYGYKAFVILFSMIISESFYTKEAYLSTFIDNSVKVYYAEELPSRRTDREFFKLPRSDMIGRWTRINGR